MYGGGKEKWKKEQESLESKMTFKIWCLNIFNQKFPRTKEYRYQNGTPKPDSEYWVND